MTNVTWTWEANVTTENDFYTPLVTTNCSTGKSGVARAGIKVHASTCFDWKPRSNAPYVSFPAQATPTMAEQQ